MAKTIKISDENYLWLVEIASKLQKERNKVIAINEALNSIKEKKSHCKDLKDLAGSWKMSDREADLFKKDLNKRWKKWPIKSS